jgi:hypothetical protein
MSTLSIEDTRTLKQRRDALRRANAVRTERAHVKRQVRALGRVQGATYMAGLIENGAPAIASLRILESLLAVPGIGPDKARRILRLVDVLPLLHIRDLSYRRRQDLASELRRVALRAEVSQ